MVGSPPPATRPKVALSMIEGERTLAEVAWQYDDHARRSVSSGQSLESDCPASLTRWPRSRPIARPLDRHPRDLKKLHRYFNNNHVRIFVRSGAPISQIKSASCSAASRCRTSDTRLGNPWGDPCRVIWFETLPTSHPEHHPQSRPRLGSGEVSTVALVGDLDPMRHVCANQASKVSSHHLPQRGDVEQRLHQELHQTPVFVLERLRLSGVGTSMPPRLDRHV